ncbi:hypothetical protein CXF85_11895 [Colwellia sp. 75C3]|uniref:tetratricopeptide repeat protein n=1 Tax=Colwellia sp. 75C3 TaxID=888425 RepID=UPI000C34AB62|nr:hypothetical protein [Colwellia sp. 75C3]PKG83042.1 hypothetical protein CXF85_11895 [Colwellia sp. 75C3]
MKITVTRMLVRSLYISLFLLGSLASTCSVATDINTYQTQLDSLDKAHQTFSKDFYKKIIKTPALQDARFNSIGALSQAVQRANKNNSPVKAIALILRNEFLLSRDYDDPKVISLVKAVLDNNALPSANKLIKNINRQGDDNVNTQLNYLLADFYFQREDWQEVLTYLDDSMSKLPLTHYHHALLIKGISLQKQGEHQASIKAYVKIPVTAKDYIAAQFNIALANIRQGWWTDGHQLISQLLASEQAENQEKTLNRLYITLGYSLLNQAYYRNARKTFQSVGLTSRYSNQALLGIALTAAHQDDYIGALNATRFLKNKTGDDLNIDEAYLLMPFFYEKSQQLATASLGYSQASTYYQNKIIALTQLINTPINFNKSPITLKNGAIMTIENTYVDFLTEYPQYFFVQRHNASQYKTQLAGLNTPKLSRDLITLTKEYDELTAKMAKSIMQNRVAQLNSYLNQSRYGLARLYDNNTVEQ